MKATMNLDHLKTIFDACKNFVSKDDIRPAQQAVQLNFNQGSCTAYATDGVKMMRVTVPYDKDGDEGTMLVPIIKLPKGPFVTLSDDGNEVVFDFFDSKQAVKKYAGDFLQDPEHCFPTAAPDLTIYFDAKNLKAALDGLKNGTIELQFHGQTGGCTIRKKDRMALVLPVRPPKNT